MIKVIITIHTIRIHANIHNDLIWKHAVNRIINTLQWDQCVFEYWMVFIMQLSYQDTVSSPADRSVEILRFKHRSEQRSTFSRDYLSLSPQSTNCTLIVLHKKTVKFITAPSQWLFSYWLKGINKVAGAWNRGTNQWIWSHPWGCEIWWSYTYAVQQHPR